jgi:hypothetical protein
MTIFTVEEANELLPRIAPKLRELRSLYAMIEEMRPRARSAAEASSFGGGMEGGTDYVEALYRVGKITTDIHLEGIQLKDYTRGLIDFPSEIDGRVVLLCWQLDEPEYLQWWHDVDAGFAGRRPL